MSDPRFASTDALRNWEERQVTSFIAGYRNGSFGVSEMFATSERIQRVRQSHAHLLTPESDNG